MAAPLVLGCGRAVAREVLRLRGASPSVALCTRPADSGMPPINVAAPQGGTKLLAIKASVEFPKMLSSSSLLASANKGESISSKNLKEASEPPAEDTGMFVSRKTVVSFPQKIFVSSHEEEKLPKPATGGDLRELAEEETSSSSSSDSDSSSDSEEENDNVVSEIAIKTKVEFPRRDSLCSENIVVKTSMLEKENLFQKSQKEYAAKKKPRKTETGVSPIKQVEYSKTSVSHVTSKSKARDPKGKSTPKKADQKKLVLEPHMVESQDMSDVTCKSDCLEEKSVGTQAAATQLKASSGIREDKKKKMISRGGKKVQEAQESEAEVTALKLKKETSESTVSAMGTTGKETIQEAGDQDGERSTIEETTAAAEPAPEEEFDNSTYKNLQHHKYNIYTFADCVVDLSKFRQPQPSSGRPSPRH